MSVRGIRGAISVEENDAGEMLRATQRLLHEMLRANAVETEEITSVLFSVTPDLTALFPALAARQVGFESVPMLHCAEIAVDGAMERIIRVLMHVNTKRSQAAMRHVYLDRALTLRPDLHKPRDL
ncbi:MAG: chorismate mutase [Candidatus Baltobacteraceae bacterium]